METVAAKLTTTNSHTIPMDVFMDIVRSGPELKGAYNSMALLPGIMILKLPCVTLI